MGYSYLTENSHRRKEASKKKNRKMASLTLVNLGKFGHAGAAIARRSTWNPRVFLAASPRPIQASSHQESLATDAIKQGTNEAKKAGENFQEKAFSTAEHVTQKTNDLAGKVSNTAQDVTEKAKQSVQEAWGSAKDTAQKAKDTVMGKAEDSKQCIKESAETVKKSMNTKD